MSGLRILGIDPGLRVTGFGIIEQHGARLQYVTSGCVRSEAASGLPARLKTLLEGLQEVITTHRPQQVAVEIVFVNNNPQATLMLGQARGACVTALVSGGQTVREYTALQLKKAVAGHGRAGKAEVQQMVMRLLKLPGLPGPDAADALGLAITHAQVGAAMDRMRMASAAGSGAALPLSGRYRDGRSR